MIKTLLRRLFPKKPIQPDPFHRSAYTEGTPEREIILNCVDYGGDVGVTVEEIENVTGISQNSIRPRLQELLELEAVHVMEMRGLTKSGRQCNVYTTPGNYVESWLP